MLKSLLLFLIISPVSLLAQSVISGKVVSLVNKNPVPTASVFLGNTSVGITSGTDGSFTLINVKNGQYDLVVSCVGYDQYHQTITVNNADIKLDLIELMPKVTALKEITVKPMDESVRNNLIKQFSAEFFGHGPNTSECTLQNPEMLDISTDNGVITASSGDFLLIINNALGYRIKYLLTDFLLDRKNLIVSYSGSFMFETLNGSASQQKKWQKNRINAYLGSDMHFLRSCIANDVADEGFKVNELIRKPNPDRPPDSVIYAKIKQFRPVSAGYSRDMSSDSLRYWSDKSRMPKYIEEKLSDPLQSKDYIRVTQVKGIYALGYQNPLQISYKNNISRTLITFHQPFSYFDNNGVIFNPKSNTMEGNWGNHRVADLLPVDYELPTTF